MNLHYKQVVLDRINFEVDREFDPSQYKDRLDGLTATDFDNANTRFGFQAVHMEGAEFPGLELSEKASPFDVELTLKIEPKSPGQFPYRVEIAISGLFIVEDEESTTIEDRKNFALIEGCATLLGTLREMLITITARSYFATLLIPAMPIRAIVREQIKANSKTKNRKRDSDATEG